MKLRELNLCLPALIVVVGLCARALQADEIEPYVRKPAWWDATAVSAEPDDLDAIWRALVSLGEDLKTSQSCELAGPYNGVLQNSLWFTYAPEKQQGEAAGWQTWEEGQKCPVDLSKGEMVVYQRLRVQVEQPCTKYLALQAPGADAAVWFDDSRVFFDDRWSQKGQERAQIVPLEVPSGEHRILIKYHRGDSRGWRLYARLFDQNPHEQSIKLRTAGVAAHLAKGTARKDLAGWAWDLTWDYLALDDRENALYWAKRAASFTDNPRFSRDVLNRLGRLFEDDPAGLELLVDVGRWAFTESQYEEARSEGLSLWINSLLQLYRPLDALAALDTVPESAGAKILKQALRRRVVVLTWLGRAEAARTARSAFWEHYPEAKKDGYVRADMAGVDRLREGIPKLAREYEFESNGRRAQEHAREPNRRILFGFIRSLLTDRNMHVIETDDPQLFRGSGPAYRDALSGYADEYRPHSQEIAGLIAQSLDMSDASLHRRQRQLSLDALEETEPPVWSGAGELPTWSPPSDAGAALGLHPVGFLRYSAVELQAMEGDGGSRISAPPVPWGFHQDGRFFVQSSRQVTAFRDGEVLWEKVFSPNRQDMGDSRERIRVVSDGFRPVSAGGTVFARILHQNRHALVALDAASGATRWQFDAERRLLCSDPVVTDGDVLVIARTQEGMSDYHLLLIDRETGKLQDELFLYSGQPRFPVHRDYADAIEFDHDIPPPTVHGTRAYICTNAGLLLAIDLTRGEMAWARTYQRLPAATSPALTRLVLRRQPVSPVVGASSVLFAPMDSLSPILVRPADGRLISTDGPRSWCDLRRLDDHKAIAVDSRQPRFWLVSLDDLSTVTTVVGESRWSLLGAASGGMVVQCGTEVGTVDSEGVFRVAAHVTGEDEQFCRGIGGAWLAVRPDESAYTMLWAGGSAASRPAPAFGRQPTSQFIEDPRVSNAGQHQLIVGANVVVKLDEDLEPVWAVPVPERPRRIVPLGDDIALVTHNRIRLVQGTTGVVLAAYPPLGAPKHAMAAATPQGDGLLLGCQIHWSRGAVMRWRPDETTGVGVYTESDGMGAFQADGKILTAHRHGKANVYDLDSATGSYVRRETSYPGDSSIAIDNATMAILKHRSRVGLLQGTEFFDVPLRKSDSEWRWKVPVANNGFLTVKYFRSHLTVIDVARKTDLSHEALFLHVPFVSGSQLYGIARNDGKTRYAAIWYDRDTGEMQRQPLEMGEFGEWRTYNERVGVEFSFGLDDTVCHVLRPNQDQGRSKERIVVIQNKHDQGLRIRRVAGFRQGTAALATDTDVLFGIDNSLQKLTREQFRSWLEAPYACRGNRNDKFVCDVDGFPDEWKPEQLQPYERCSVAGTLVKGEIALLVAVKSPEVIETLLKDPEQLQRLQLMSCPGGLVGMVSETVYDDAHVHPVFGSGIEGWRADWHVTPAGDTLYLEIAAPVSALTGLERDDLKRIGSRSSMGDVALNLLLRKDDGTLVPLLAPKTDPSGHPRIYFGWF